jgi:hypothetical protein
MLNPYNRLITMSWLANTDIQPCTRARAVIEYVGKYAAKAEKASTSYKELAATVLPFINQDTLKPFKSFVTKIMNRLVGERDWSTQEVCHLLLNLPLSNSTRRVLNVNVKRPKDQPQLFVRYKGQVDGSGTIAKARKGRSLLQKYMERPEELEHVTYLDFCRKFTHDNKPRRRPRAKDRCLNIWPRYKKDNDDEMEDFARARLMLHHPCRTLADLYKDDIDEDVKTTYQAVYASCLFGHNHPLDGYDDEDETFDFADASPDDPQGPDHTGCDYYWVNDCYRVSPEVAHCIWCNHKLAISHLSRRIQCGECRHDKPPATFLSSTQTMYHPVCRDCDPGMYQ